jgi:hypothetical protein
MIMTAEENKPMNARREKADPVAMATYGRPFFVVFKNNLGALPAAARPSTKAG